MSKQALYAPKADDNPWRVDTYMNVAEWKEVSRWYPFSLRSLMPDGRWLESRIEKGGNLLWQNNDRGPMKNSRVS